MDIAEFLSPECIATGIRASSKRRVLELLAEALAKGDPGLNTQQVFDGLLARERLGGTGLGKGIALPHSRMKGGQRVIGAFLQLTKGIAFDAIDNATVDLFFALVVPDQATDEHLRILAHLARMFSDSELRQCLREAQGAVAIHKLITTWQPSE
ncbi:phosphotransferase system enzyme IIA(Ntr) [Gammaproteobacteria bacterium]